ncbi:MAG: hypothetical protein Q4G27_03365 [Flavobacteriaceae bacterium]|nr:hypothetical protein [Flavobacteriaceae bacterium]
MKFQKLSFLIAILLPLIAISCSGSDDDSAPNTDTNVPVIITNGTWRITLYNDNGENETYHFSGYTFDFSHGVVTATKIGNSVTGTYAIGVDDGHNKLYLDFGVVVPFEELNDDWHIVEESATKVRLQDVSGGNGGTDLLTFEKN